MLERHIYLGQTYQMYILVGPTNKSIILLQQVYHTTSTSPLMRTVTLRMKNNEPVNIYALFLPPHGKRPLGGQRMSFVKSILKKINPTGVLTAQDIIQDAQSKDGLGRLAVTC